MNIIVGVLAVFASACTAAEARPAQPTGSVSQARSEIVRFEVKGMACQACAARLQAGIRNLEGVSNASVDFSTKILTVQLDPAKIDAGRIASEVERLGFEAKPVRGAS